MRKRICTENTPDLDNDLPSSPAAEEVGGNEDLLREIFLRLPVRLLITFKSVSKHWFSLISDPQFSLKHTLLRNPSSAIPSGLFFYDSITKSTEIDYVSLETVPVKSSTATRVRVPSLSFLDGAVPSATTIEVLQSISGLLLCRFTLHSSDSEVKHEYCVCNPTTRNYTLIPQPTLIEPESVVEFYLAFEPSESPYYKIICIKPLSRRYKFCRDLGLCQLDIYSSENRIWRSTSCRFSGSDFVQFDKTAIYWNGVLHWVKGDFMRFFSCDFDIKEEKLVSYKLMHNMSQSSGNQPLRYLGECRGHLHLIYVRTPSSKIFRVLEKDRETLKWCVRYRVHLNRFLPTFPELALPAGQNGYGTEYAFSILYVYKGEKEEDSALVLTIPGKVVSYNFHSKTVKVLRELPARNVDTRLHKYVTGFHFIETLALA